MNRSLPMAAIVIAAFALAVSLFAALDRGEVREPGDAEKGAPGSADSKEVEPARQPVIDDGEVLLLRNRVDRLAERLADLERGSAPAVANGTEPLPVAVHVENEAVDLRPLAQRLGGLEQKVERLAGLMPQPVANALTEDEKAREAVSGIVQEQLDKFREERQERHRSMGDQVTDELVNEFAEKAGLSDEQFGKLYPAVTEMRQTMRENFRAMRKGEKDFADVRAEAKAAREAFDEKARGTLTEEQFKMYQEEMNQRFGGPGGLFR